MDEPWYSGLDATSLLRVVVEAYAAWPDAYRTDPTNPSKTFPVMLTFGNRLIPLSELRRIVEEQK